MDEAARKLAEEVGKIQWYHTIDLGSGIITPGVSDTAVLIKRLCMPESFAGKTVLDIGAADGAMSFECERRGASRVLATDWFFWGGGHELGVLPAGWSSKAGFELARRARGSKVEDLDIDVPDISPESVGVFDVVLFLGVLYHLKHPLLALERVASVTREMLLFETSADFLWIKRPAIAFYPGEELNADETNWVGPNLAACIGMLRTAGFQRVEVVHAPGSLYRLLRALKAQYLLLKSSRQGNPIPGAGTFLRTFSQGRVFLHAWK